jgi:outer membrane receptor protein involved in Fe transport
MIREVGVIPCFVQIPIIALAASLTAGARFEARLVDQKTGAPIAGAEVTIVGEIGSVRTDADGRFSWKPDPKPPFTILIVLPGGQVAKPVYVDRLDPAAVMTVTVEAVLTEEVTVAGGVAPSIDATPGAAMTMLSSRDVALRGPANLMQSIESVPGVNQVSEGQAAVPAVRGLARGRTLILIDGGRVTSERRVGPSASFLDPAIVEGVDIARGPGSVAYGSDAFGGVISVRTRRPALTGRQFSASVTGGGGIPDRRVEGTFSQGFGSSGVIVSAHTRDVGDYDSPAGGVLNSGWSDSGVLVRAERRDGSGTLSASWQGDFARDVERPRNNSNAVRFYSPFENSHRVTAGYDRLDAGGFDIVKVSGFFGTSEQRTDQDRIATATRARDIARADISAKDFQVRVIAERAFGTRSLEVGADVSGRFGLEAHDITIQYDLDGDVASVADHLSTDSARRTDTALFVQGATSIGAQVSATAGLRADYVRNVNRGGFFGDHAVSNGAAAGFAAVAAGPFANVTLTAQVARGFRDPTLSDRFYRGPTGRGFITGNPDLDPETSAQVDFGARYTTRRARVAAYFYHYRFSDLIERYEAEPDFFFFRNRGRARVRGVEIEAQLGLGSGFTLEAAGQISRGRALDDDGALDDISPDSFSFVLRKAQTARLMWYVRLARSAADDRPGPSEIAAPGHTNLDAGASWFVTDRLEIRGAVRNILDEEYYASPDPRFVLAPGINGSVTLAVRF